MQDDPRFLWDVSGPSRLNRRAIPDIQVTDHEGNSLRFYRHLVEGRLVLIAFTSLAHDVHSGCIPKLAQVRAELDRGPALGTEIYTLTVDPGRDTARAWARRALEAGAGRGWRFLHAEPDAVEALRGALFVHRGATGESGQRSLWRRADLLKLRPERAVMDCSLGLLRYGNESLDIWGGVPIRSRPEAIAQRLEWVSGALCRPQAGRRRGGPLPERVS